MIIQEREYQTWAEDAFFKYMDEHPDAGNPLILMPTGTGKSVVIARILKRLYRMWDGFRVLVITDVKELVKQNFEKLLSMWPAAPAGILSAGLKRRDIGSPILFAGIGTAVNVCDALGHIDIVLMDECEAIPPDGEGMYRTLFAKLKEKNPRFRVVGLTATDYRQGTGRLTTWDEPFFTDVCFDGVGFEAFNWFVDQGYIVDLITRNTTTQIDLSKVQTQGGEYNQKQLQAASLKEEITREAVDEAISLGGDRQCWLVFASGIEHAEMIVDVLQEKGVSAVCVHSKMSEERRDKNLETHRLGKVKAIVSNGILTKGYDDVRIDLILMLRGTQSARLWVQMLGRGTRPDYAGGYDLFTQEGRLEAIARSDKPNCLVLDYVRNAKRLGPINDPVIKVKGSGGGDAPVRECRPDVMPSGNGCHTINHASARVCKHCGEAFPDPQVKIQVNASGDAVRAKSRPEPKIETPRIEEFRVDHVTFQRHKKDGRPDSVKVTYYCGLKRFQAWHCFEELAPSRRHAIRWWKDFSLDEPPSCTDEALDRLPNQPAPRMLRVWVNKQYPEIMSYVY